MKIGNTSGSNAVSAAMQAGNAGSQDGQIKNIEKQISDVQEQMRKLGANDEMSLEAKIESKKELQQKLQDLNKQLAQRKIAVRQEEQQKRAQEMKALEQKNAPKQENKSGMMQSPEMQNIISAESAMKQVNATQSVKTQLEGRTGVLEMEIKLDSARGGTASAKVEALAETKAKINQVTSDMISQAADINKELAEADGETGKTEELKESDDQEKNKNADIKDSSGTNEEDVAETAENASGSAGTMENYKPVDVRL